jgi:hypothetical protein
VIQFPLPIPAERIGQCRTVQNLAATLGVIPPGSVAVEVGVSLGDLTELLLNQPAIAKLWVMDHFDLHSRPKVSAAAKLGGKKHLAYVSDRFSAAIRSNRLETRIGRLDAIKALPAGGVNAFFIRGCREFGPLMSELYMCDAKLRSRGMIWVADYIMADYMSGEKYETVRAVNEFARKSSYDLAYFVLEHTRSCTVVLRKPS